MKTKEIINLVNLLAKEKKMDTKEIFNSIKEAMERGYKKEVDPDANVVVDINETTGDIKAYTILRIVEDDQDDSYGTITLQEAKKIRKTAEIGEEINNPIDIDEISRIGALHAKQVIRQKFTENQRQKESSA
jgi:N utilization substance protein A